MPVSAQTAEDLRTAFAHLPVQDEGAALVVFPSTTDEAAALLRFCHARTLPVEIAGARTKRNWAGSTEGAITLNTKRLGGVHEHPWQDLTATVGAGTPWADMQATLAARRQFVALDPLWPERATVGGILASNDSGALRLRYGSARDLVIGMTVVLADGTIAKTGGKVVKNVAGYDLHKLMIGAFGTLALITEVTFRLHPLPSNRAAWSVSSPEIGPIGKLIAAITTSVLNPESIQIRAAPHVFTLDVLLAGAVEVLVDKGSTLRSLAISQGLAAVEASDPAHVLRARETVLHQPRSFVLKAALSPADVPAFAKEVKEKNGHCVAQSCGVMFAAFPEDELSFKLAEEFRYHVGLQGGSTVLVQRSDISSRAEWSTQIAESAQPSSLPIMREIKRQFDPNYILNRGAMGGI